jgi:hypothetical protein
MEKEFTKEQNPNFFKLWDLKCVQRWRDDQKHLKDWYTYEIYAKTTKDLEMSVWNGTHPVEENTTKHNCKAGTKVRVWMASRFGDVGVTDNLETPRGYDVRGLDADVDLTNYEFIERGAVANVL